MHASDKPSSTKHQQAALVRTIGQRLREARELCNLSLSAAAKRLGYANPSKLSKVERATDTNSVPLWLILRAARAYEVSIDFLFGATDDWEVGARMTQEREVSGWLADAIQRDQRKMMAALVVLHDRMEQVRQGVTACASTADEADAALTRFVELNPGFVDMPGGNRLVTSVKRAKDAGDHSRARLSRFRAECRAAVQDSPQLSLTL